MGSHQVRSLDAAAAEVQSATDHDSAATVTEDTAIENSAVPNATRPTAGDELDDPRSVALSEPFVTRWSVLISTTNWEKGAIIGAWRLELQNQNAPATAYSDEAWSRRVGGVTSQHVGRLRRVHQRFGESHKTYPNLYWTHFLSALDWDDAEMWLEGASQSKWSVSQMRDTRWQANGGDPDSKPEADEVVGSSLDEDYSPSAEPLNRLAETDEDESHNLGDVASGPRSEGPDFGDESDQSGGIATDEVDGEESLDDIVAAEPGVSPFAALPVLPVDVADALEQFKLAIIRHRASEWAEFSREDMLRTIDALRAFTVQ